MVDKLSYIPITQIRANPNALREVDRSSEKYMGLVDSVRRKGVILPVLVREAKDVQTGEDYFSLIDGLHRFSAGKDAGLKDIPAKITSMEDADAMLTQIMANVHKVETLPSEYTDQLIRIMGLQPTLTVTELAGQLSKSVGWINDRLSLTKLQTSILELVDTDKVNLLNAYALAKLPPDEQGAFIERAMTDPPTLFVQAANARAKELKDAARQGRAPKSEEFQAHPRIRKMSEIQSELTTPEVGRILLEKFKITSAQEAFDLGVKWVSQMDPDSVATMKEGYESKKRAEQEKKDTAKKERQAKKDADAKEKAARVNAELAQSNGTQTAGELQTSGAS